ncbi:MAG: sugar phosphate nucleotidyltransferase, partial [Deltaproteobacteria bacterium]
MLIPVILSGGSGTRLWPLSRELYPKQLLALTGDMTLLQQTAARLENFANAAPPIIVCNEEHRFLVAEQLRAMEITPTAIILEPVGRNTAPATAVAALQALANDLEALILVLPADHLIKDVSAFRKAVTIGIELAKEGKLVTFGIKPDKPETGYGYIKLGEALGSGREKKAVP